ncbi:MAG: S-adenosyl-l-methionine hydroxide adenosyltransferase family protein [Bacteroidales bacterium]
MIVITLTSDWGSGNHYSGTVKGALLKQLPQATIVDISHEIASYDLMQASFVLKNAYPSFPKGTIHLIGVNTEAGIESPHVAVQSDGQFFIGADNGIFPLLLGKEPEAMVELNVMQDSDYFTFSTRDVFVKAAAMLASGHSLEEIGHPHPGLNEKIPFKPVVYDERITGKVIFVDTYENVFVNIDAQLFREVGQGRSFLINFRSPDDGISQLHQSYSDVVPGEKLALFGSTGFLEIAINQGKAASLLGLQMNDTVTVEFIPQ